MSLSSEKLVSKFAFKFNLYRYAMVGSKGLDDGVDHDTTRDLIVPHT